MREITIYPMYEIILARLQNQTKMSQENYRLISVCVWKVINKMSSKLDSATFLKGSYSITSLDSSRSDGLVHI
jgi:hypothetical protein